MTTTVTSRPFRILLVNTSDLGGGAEKAASDLLLAYRKRGHDSWLAVGRKRTDDRQVLSVPNEESRPGWVRWWRRVQASLDQTGHARVGRCASWLASLGELRRRVELRRGIEDVHFPGTARLLQLPPARPDVVHAHNLHGGYFDLRRLARLSHEIPVVVTLHDTWLLGGHCSYSYDCERWKVGCGACPDLRIYPSIPRDGSASSWRRKKRIFARCRLHVAAPSRWLMQKVEESMLAPAVVDRQIIPYGVDLSIFRPSHRGACRQALEIPEHSRVLLSAASRLRSEPRKGYVTLRETMELIAMARPQRPIVLLALGEDAPGGRVGSVEVRFVPYQKEPGLVARYYQAADLFIHAAWADNFPFVVLEALASGVPVVATAVGGIPEQVKAAEMPGAIDGYQTVGEDEATGALIRAGDARGMAAVLVRLMREDALRARLSANAVGDARARFDLDLQVNRYLAWYADILAAARAACPGG